MNYETYFPEQRHLLSQAVFRRDRLLPLDLGGEIEVEPGEHVDLHSPIVRGDAPSDYIVIDAAQQLRLHKRDQLNDQLQVEVGDMVEPQQILAGKPNKPKKAVRSPILGTVAYIGEGQIILQQLPQTITVEAGLIGQVVEVRPGRGVVLEGMGAVVQGVWGNDHRAIGTLRLEPDDGLEHIYSEAIDSPYRGTIVIARRPLKALSLQVLVDQEIAGVIAPSMEPNLIEEALACPRAILLTEGFGSMRMGGALSAFLINYQGRQATLDAAQSGVLEARRPELVITVPINPGEHPSMPRLDQTLHIDTQVRLTRGQFAGSIGQVINLPKDPVLLDNGLRIHGANINLITGETVFVPLDNLEVLG